MCNDFLVKLNTSVKGEGNVVMCVIDVSRAVEIDVWEIQS